MNIVEAVLSKIQLLPIEKQQTVLDYVDFLVCSLERQSDAAADRSDPEIEGIESFTPRSALGEKLRAIRQSALEKGMQKMSVEEVDAEIAEHRRYHIFYGNLF